jgi:hypothetical protein
MNMREEIEKMPVAASMVIGACTAALPGAWAQTQNRVEKQPVLRDDRVREHAP